MRALKIAAAVFCLLLLCGCWDYNEMSMQDIVIGVGVDYTDNGFAVCIDTARIGDKEERGIYETEGGSFFDAVRNAIEKADKKLYWGHCQTLVIDEETARAHMDEILDVLTRAQDVYLNVSVITARGCTAADIIKAKPASGDTVSQSIANMFRNQGNSKRFEDIRIWELMRRESVSDTYVLPTAALSGEYVSLGGGAVFRGGKLVGYLDDTQMLFYILLTSSGTGGYIPPLETEPGVTVTLEILRNRVKTEYIHEDGGTIAVQSELIVSLGGTDNANAALCEEGVSRIERVLCGYMNSGFENLLEMARANQFGDLFGFGHIIKRADYTAWERLNGQHELPVHFDTRVVLNSTGMLKNSK